MKRILCILSILSAGGAETFLMKVSRALPPEEYQLDFIVSVEGGCYTQEVLDRGGKIYRIPLRTRDPIGAFRGIWKVVRSNRYDCVLKLGETSIAAVDLIAAKLGGTTRLAMRSCNALTGLSLTSRCIHSLLRPVLNHVANIKLAPSMLAAEFTFGKRCANREVQLIHNGVDLNVFRFDEEGRRRIREEFSLGDRLVVGHVGRFHEQKNHKYLLEVFREIRNQRHDAVLLLVGSGELEGKVRDQAKDLGLEDAIIFTGSRFDIPQLMSAMDVFVFPSFFEGMPNTVIEAQATGLPCVIADTITAEADITGLVKYLALSDSTEKWAETALESAAQNRRDTHQQILEKGYDIQSVAKTFAGLLMSSDFERAS